MKYKITRQLLSYFLIILFSFSIIVTAIFLLSGRNMLKKQYMDDAKIKVEKVSRTLSENSDLLAAENNQIQENMESSTPPSGKAKKNNAKMGPMMKGGQRYMKIINDILNSNVLIYDRNAKDPIGLNVLQAPFDLNSPVIQDLISSAFNNEVKVSTLEENTFHEEIIVSAAPVYASDGTVSNAVLVFNTSAHQYPILKEASKLLITVIALSIIIIAILSYFFAQRYAKPLIQANNMTLAMMDGDYSQRLNINRNDEIGTLTENIDNFAITLEGSRKKLEGLEQMRKDFISSISHELKTPVAVLKGNLESLRDDMVSEENKSQVIETLNDEIITLERLIADLMELTGLSNPNFPIQMEEVYISDILNDSIRSMRSIASKKNIEIKSNLTEINNSIQGDYTRLKQLFIILLDNAIKFSSDKSVVEVLYREPLNVSISNYGKELSIEEIDSIFKPFYKVDINSSGKGLGLSIAKEIAQRHGLDIKVDSNSGKTTFSIFK